MHPILSASVLFFLSFPALAGTQCAASSGAMRAALLELYTSEGCSSCPPADQWLSNLPTQNLDALAVVPLAFHVDYWDKLGWVDPFAQAAFTQRQRERNGRLGWVYTPQFMLNGEDYRPGKRSLQTALARSPSSAVLKLNLDRTDTRRWVTHVEATLNTPAERHQLLVE